MFPCAQCNRPLLAADAPCPFCPAPTRPNVARWVQRAGTVAMPFLLGACYGPPGGIADCWTNDLDADGWRTGNCGVQDDCDDVDPTINPDATEVCDGVDNDCNGMVDDDCDEDSDTTEPPVTGDLEVFLFFPPSAPTCTDVGLSAVTLTLDGPEPVLDARLGCVTETPLESPLLAPGDWSVHVEGDSLDGTQRWASEPVDTRIVAGSVTTIGVQMACEALIEGACDIEADDDSDTMP